MELEEPMEVDAGVEFDDLLEEGECVESNRVSRKNIPSIVSVPEVKPTTFITGVDVFSKETEEKLEERAKRFGIKKEAERSAVKEAESLYESFGIVEGSENAKDYRLNVIHMRGTENMTTKDVFKYFEDYAPASIEWINDISCNVIWLDKISAVRAILGLSKKIIGLKKNSKDSMHSDEESGQESDDDVIVNGRHHVDEYSIHVKDIRCPLPPGIWRKGRDYKDSRNIFLRFATRSDRKPNLHQGGLKGILTNSRKRAYKQIREPTPPPQAIPDGNGIAAKNPWGSLSKNWGVTDFVEDDYLPKAPIEPVSNVRERLGFKHRDREEIIDEPSDVIELSDSEESESSSDADDWCKRSKVPRMRMHADDEEEKIQKRKGKIRNLVNHTTMTNSNDLRKHLTARRRLPQPVYKEDIQVVLTNPKAIRNDLRNLDASEDEEEDDVSPAKVVLPDDDEEEEGEIVDDSNSGSNVEEDDEEEEEEEAEAEAEEDEREETVEEESESDNDSSNSSISGKEIQGPKGSVIKVVPRKPKLQSTVSTVWSRLNTIKKEKDVSPDRCHSKTDLRHTLRKNDLRSRIGNQHMRGRSPLRIELRNDKYAGRRNDSD